MLQATCYTKATLGLMDRNPALLAGLPASSPQWQRDSHGPSPVLGSGEPPTAHSSCSGKSPAPQPLSALGPQGAERLLLWHSGGSPGPSLCSEAPQEGLGTPFHGVHRGCSGPGSAPCSNSITCKFSSGSPLAQGCLLPLGQRGERPGPSVLTSGNPWGAGGGSQARDHPQNH